MNKKYKSEFDQLAFDYIKEYCYQKTGFCKIFGVHQKTIRAWRKSYPSFNEAILRGKKEHWNF